MTDTLVDTKKAAFKSDLLIVYMATLLVAIIILYQTMSNVNYVLDSPTLPLSDTATLAASI